MLELVYETICHPELPQDALSILDPAINDEPANTRKFVSKNNLWHKINSALASPFDAALFSLNFCVINAAEENLRAIITSRTLPFLDTDATFALKMLVLRSFTIELVCNEVKTVNYFNLNMISY